MTAHSLHICVASTETRGVLPDLLKANDNGHSGHPLMDHAGHDVVYLADRGPGRLDLGYLANQQVMGQEMYGGPRFIVKSHLQRPFFQG